MQLKTLLPTLLLSTSLIGASYANLQDGVDAYKKGNYKADDLTIKKLTNENPIMKEKFNLI